MTPDRAQEIQEKAVCDHNWQHEKANEEAIMERCDRCGVFRMAERSQLSQTADKIVETYKRRGYHFLDALAKKYEPRWVELTLEQIGEIVEGRAPLPFPLRTKDA